MTWCSRELTSPTGAHAPVSYQDRHQIFAVLAFSKQTPLPSPFLSSSSAENKTRKEEGMFFFFKKLTEYNMVDVASSHSGCKENAGNSTIRSHPPPAPPNTSSFFFHRATIQGFGVGFCLAHAPPNKPLTKFMQETDRRPTKTTLRTISPELEVAILNTACWVHENGRALKLKLMET